MEEVVLYGDTNRVSKEADKAFVLKSLHTAPGYIWCPLTDSLDTFKLEGLMQRRGLCEDGVSLKECLAKNYGEDVADACERLINCEQEQEDGESQRR